MLYCAVSCSVILFCAALCRVMSCSVVLFCVLFCVIVCCPIPAPHLPLQNVYIRDTCVLLGSYCIVHGCTVRLYI